MSTLSLFESKIDPHKQTEVQNVLLNYVLIVFFFLFFFYLMFCIVICRLRSVWQWGRKLSSSNIATCIGETY